MSEPTTININPTTPSAPPGFKNVIPQADAATPERNASMYMPVGDTDGAGAVRFGTGDFEGTGLSPVVGAIRTIKVVTDLPTTRQILYYDTTNANQYGRGGCLKWANVFGGVDARTTTTETITDTSRGMLVTLANASAIAVSLDSTVDAFFACQVEAAGAGAATLTPSSGTISAGNGAPASSLVIAAGSSGWLWRIGSNWHCVLSGSGGGTATGGVNTQTGTSYTVVSGDNSKLVTLTNASAIAVTLPNANTLANTFYVDIENRGAGTVTITPATSTIDGAASLALLANQGVRVFGDGTNYFTQRGNISDFVGDSGSGGVRGAVPAPAAGDAAAQKYLKSDGTWAPVSGGTGGGGLVLLEQHTASGGATLDFTSWLSSSYDEYIIEVVNVVPATNNVGFRMRFSTNAGSTWDSGSNYFWSMNWGKLSNRALSAAGTIGTSTEILLGITGVSSTAGNGGNKGYYRFFNPGGSTTYKLIKGETIQSDGGSSDIFISDLLAKYTNSSAINGIRFYPDTGNLSSGTIRIYGLSK